MLMFIDMGGGGFDEEITDYVDIRRGLQKLNCFALKARYTLRFQTKFPYLIYCPNFRTNDT